MLDTDLIAARHGLVGPLRKKSRYRKTALWLIVSGWLAWLSQQPALANDTAAFQQWNSLLADFGVDDNDRITVNLIARTQSDSTDIGVFSVRLGWDHRSNDGKTLGIIYAYFETDQDSGRSQRQHRLTQSLTLPFGRLAGGHIEGRFQAEEAVVEGFGSDIGVRLRGRLRWIRPIKGSNRLAIEASEELITRINDTRWGQQSGFAASRATLGLRIQVNDQVNLTPAYVWQLSDRNGPDDQQLQILSMTVVGHF